MRLIRQEIACVLLSLLVSAGYAQTAKKSVKGYLDPTIAKDFLTVIPASPHAGDLRDTYDRSIFRGTRSLQGSPRWTLAQQDNNYSTDQMLKDFSCSLGVELNAQNAPRLAALVMRVGADSSAIVGKLKNQYKRPRPFVSQSGDICIARSPDLLDSYDYPSGHATKGWLIGLILAEMAPDRTGPVLTRARAFGESRVICGVHTASAVDAGRTLASGILAALEGSMQYRDDFVAAKGEMEALRKSASLASSSCATERSLTISSPFDSLPDSGSTLGTDKANKTH